MAQLFRTLSLFALLLSGIASIHAQVQTGTPPFASFGGGPEVINLGNLNSHFVIPVLHKPGRGTPFTYDLSYDTSIWYPVGSSGNQYWQPAGLHIWGWAGQTEVAVGYISATQTEVNECGFWKPLGGGHEIFIVTGYTYDLTNWVYHDQFRASHPFTGSTTEYTGSCTNIGPNTSFTSIASDGSGYTLNANGGTGSVTYRKGDVAQPNTNVGNGSATYRDVNGNLITVDGSGHFYDTLSGTTPVMTLSGSGTPASPNVFTYNLPSGSPASYTMNFVAYTAATNFGISGIHEYGATVVNLVDNIQLPDNSTYKFTYEQTPSLPASGACTPKAGTFQSYCVTGRLASVTLPTGGKINYAYSGGNNGIFGDGTVATLTRTVTDGGSWSGTWIYARSQVSGSHWQTTVTAPTNDTTVIDFQEDNGTQNFYETQRQVYQGSPSGTLYQTLTTCYNGNTSNCPTTAITLPITQQNTTNQLGSGGTRALQVVKLNSYGLPTEEDDYDFTTGTPSTILRKVVTTYASLSNGIVSLPAQISICNPTTGTSANCNGTGTPVAQTLYYYDQFAPSSAPSGTPQLSPITGGRGNLTTVQRCTSVSACNTSNVQISMTYDTAGQLQTIKDGNGNTTSFSYADSFFTDNGSNPAATYSSPVPTDAYLTKVTLPTNKTANYGYYYYSGQLAVSTDQNGNSSYSHFQDILSRQTSTYGPTVPLPAGGSARPWVLTAYSSLSTQIDAYIGILDTAPSTSCSICRHDQALVDGLGRTVHSYLVSDPEGKTTTDTAYDPNGRVQTISHPYRSTSDSTYGFEAPTYDVLGRTTKLTRPDGTYSQSFYGTSSVVANGGAGTQNCSSSTYGTGYPVLSIDESGRKHQIWVDALGRTIEGDEPDSTGNLTSYTCYSHDYLSNILQILHGSQARAFAYDPLSRITSATIPELANSSGQNCSVSYSYDNNSNLQTRTAPAPNQTSCVVNTNSSTYVTTTYSYDTVNRLVKVSYSNASTSTVQYGYDGNSLSGCATTPPSLTDPNPNGLRTSMCDGSGATSWAHDAAGRITTESRIISGVNKSISYAYNLDNTVAAVTYPGGKTVTYTVSNAERLTTAKDTASGTQFAMVASYAPFGALQGMITGQVSGGFGGVTESHTYNNSLEYTSTQATSSAGTALNLTLNHNLAGGDNGTVTSITNNVDNGRTQTFGYDPLNRISSTSSQATSGADCWGQTFAPDSLGNLNSITSTKCNSTMLNLGVDANNHINNSGFGYDAAGNMTQDGSSGVTYYFDAENHMYKITGISGGPYCYFYDGNGVRVAKKSGANSDCTGGTFSKLSWRSISGDALAETDSTGSVTNTAYNEYVFFSGRRIASRNGSGTIFYYFTDQLGSTRTITTGNGTGQTPGQLCYDADFTPYGLEIQHTERLQTTGCPPNYKFTGYERDSETDLDYAFARYYSPSLNRFYSTDPLGGSIGSLQSHNAYSYVLNNPSNLTDPAGECPNWGPFWVPVKGVGGVIGRIICTSAKGPSSRELIDTVFMIDLWVNGDPENWIQYGAYLQWIAQVFGPGLAFNGPSGGGGGKKNPKDCPSQTAQAAALVAISSDPALLGAAAQAEALAQLTGKVAIVGVSGAAGKSLGQDSFFPRLGGSLGGTIGIAADPNGNLGLAYGFRLGGGLGGGFNAGGSVTIASKSTSIFQMSGSNVWPQGSVSVPLAPGLAGSVGGNLNGNLTVTFGTGGGAFGTFGGVGKGGVKPIVCAP